MRRLEILRRLRGALVFPRVLLWLACVAIVVMYACNHDMNHEPDAVRGDGKYHPVLARGDGHLMYLMARSTALDLDWDFGNDLRRFGDPWNEPISPVTHRKEVVNPIGPALVWTPLIWVATGAAAIVNQLGGSIPLHGYTLWVQRFVLLSSALFGCLAVWLAWRLASRTIGGRYAPTYAAVAVLLGTSLTYYATFMPSYTHAMDAAACGAFLAYWAHTIGRTDMRRFVVLGVLLGVAMLIRVQELPLGVTLAIEAASTRKLRSVIGGLVTLAVALVVFVPQLLEWHVVFGSVRGLPQGPRFTRFNAPMIAELLWSPRNGWLSTTPIAYFACIGLAFIPRKHRLVATGLIVVVAIQIYLNSTVLDWWSGASFGQRRLCSVTLPLVVGLAALIARTGHLLANAPRWVKHGIAALVLVPLVAFNLRGVLRLRGGVAAPSELVHSCCSAVPRWARGPVTSAYRHIGNPFQFPANLVFALRHDVPITRWDEIVGEFAIIPSLADVRTDDLSTVHSTWGLTDRFLSSGWSPLQSEPPIHFRTVEAEHATILVPNQMPDPIRITVSVAAPVPTVVTLEWNGDVVAVALARRAWSPIAFVVEGDLHVNELTVHGRGVQVSDLQLQLLH